MNRLPALLVSSLILVACTGPDPIPPTENSEEPSQTASARTDASTGPSSDGIDKALPRITQNAKVMGFERPKSCDDLLAALKKRGRERVTSYGFTNDDFGYLVEGKFEINRTADYNVAEGEGVAAPGAPAAAGSAASSAEHSTTNTQEADVGEFADTVTNGKIIASVVWHHEPYTKPVGGRVYLINPENLEDYGFIDVEADAEQAEHTVAFADDKTLLILSSYFTESGPRTQLKRVDVSDPSKAKVTSTLRLSGKHQSVRLIDGKVILTNTAAPPGLNFTSPLSKSVRSDREALEKNRKIVEDSKLEQWLADAEILDGEDKPIQENLTLANCDQILLSEDRTFVFTSVASVDPSRPVMTLQKGSAVLGNVDGAYSSKDRVVTWMHESDRDTDLNSQLVSFDISKPEAINLGATGAVRGTIRDVWDVDEEGGVIRIASTAPSHDNSKKRESRVTVLQEQGEELVPVGLVNGLGLGEEIKSVRWLTPKLGVVVTFRQTDPVYTIDTTDPSKPKMAGELKIPGYSAYLHPVGKDRLLGIGQNADPSNGRPLGFKYSLFDISDLSAPKELDSRDFIGAESKAEYNHQAFTWYKDRGYLAMSDNRFSYAEKDSDMYLTVSGVQIKDDKIQVLGKGELKTHDVEGGANTVVIGDYLYAANPSAIGKFKADDIHEEKQRFLP